MYHAGEKMSICYPILVQLLFFILKNPTFLHARMAGKVFGLAVEGVDKNTV
jgi:hypothetical protein